MADQAKLRKRLEALLKLPENQACCDCGKRGPRWASANLGNFFCIECSGIHRNLGVHISFVRSVNLDSWTPKQVEFMEQWGNARANAYWEANLPSHVKKPNGDDNVRVVERYIRDKYEHKKFVAASIPPPNGARQATAPEPSRAAAPVSRAPARAAPREEARRAPAPVAAPAPAPAVDLLDFDFAPAAPVAPPAAAPVPVPQQQHAQQQHVFGFGQQQHVGSHSSDGFGDFNGHDTYQQHGAPAQSAPQQPQQFQDPFGAPQQHQHQQQQQFGGDPFGASRLQQAPPQQQAPAQPARPQASTDAILSLYSSGGGGTGSVMHGGPMMGAQGGHASHMGGMHGGPHHHYGQHPPQQGGGQYGMAPGGTQYGGMPSGGMQQHHGYPPQQGHGGYPPQGQHAPQHGQQYGAPPPQQYQYHQQQPQGHPQGAPGGWGQPTNGYR